MSRRLDRVCHDWNMPSEHDRGPDSSPTRIGHISPTVEQTPIGSNTQKSAFCTRFWVIDEQVAAAALQHLEERGILRQTRLGFRRS
jgi:hypothetical protein